MTLDEVKERYGKVPCTFSSYWKYTFSFLGRADDGAIISIGVGGNADDIYRFEVTSTSVRFLDDADRIAVEFNGETVFSETV